METERVIYVPFRNRAFTVWVPWRRRPTICIPRKRRHDRDWVERTIRHEMVHLRQWLEFGRIGFGRRYFFSAKWRFILEGPAFAESVQWWWDRGWYYRISPEATRETLGIYAEALATKYRLKRGVAECRSLILSHLGGVLPYAS